MTMHVPVERLAARRRPGVVLALYGVELAVGWAIASPWIELVRKAWGAHPDGDRALFWQPGHIDLVDFLMRQRQALSALFTSSLSGLALWFVAGIAGLGVLLSALTERDRFGLRRAATRGGELFGRLCLLQLAGAVMVPIAFVVVGVMPRLALATRLEALDPRRAFVLGLLPLILAVSVVAFLVSLVDLARALTVRHDLGTADALRRAFGSPRAVLALVGLSLPRWLAIAGTIGAGAAFSTASTSILAIFVVHQLLALARVGLRASVLARALRLSDSAMQRAA